MPDNSEQPPMQVASPKRPTLMAPIAPITIGEDIPLEAGKINPSFPEGNASFPTGVITIRYGWWHGPHKLLTFPLFPTGGPWGNQNSQCPTLTCLPPGPSSTHYLMMFCTSRRQWMTCHESYTHSVRASLDAQQWRLISDIETTLHQNEAKATEAIKIAKACYAGTICKAKAMYAIVIREADTNHSTSIMEVEGGHSTTVKRYRSYLCGTCTLDLQQAYGEAIRTLINEAIKEDGWACQSFLWACRVALQVCPTESLGIFVYPIQLLAVNMSFTGVLDGCTPQQTISLRGPILSPSHTARPTMVAHSTRTKQPHNLPGCTTQDWTDLEINPHHTPKSCPNEGKRKGIPWRGDWRVPTRRAFAKDSNLAKQIRHTYFRAHHWEFDNKTTHNLTHIFREMVDVVMVFWMLRYIWFRTHVARQEGAPGSQSCSYKFFQGDLLFLGGVTHGIPKDHGSERDKFPWSPEMPWWSFILLLMQEGGAEWRHGG